MKKFIILVLFGSMLNVLEAQNDSIKVCPYFWKDNTPMQIENISVGMATQTGTFPMVFFSTLSGPDGCADFPLDPLSSTDLFNFSGGKDDNSLDGISVLDLVAMSKHILGIDPLDGIPPGFAADINRSGSITTFDIVLLRKMILTGIATDTDFGFIQKNCSEPNNNPFAMICPAYSKQELEQLGEVELTGWKRGDVDGDYLGFKPPADTVNLIFPNMILTAGVPVQIPVKLSANSSISFAAIQLSLKADPLKVQIDSISDGTIDVFEANTNLNTQGELRVVTSYDFFNNIEQGILFYLYLTPSVNTTLKDVISLQLQQPSMFVPESSTEVYWTPKLAFSGNVSQQETPAAAAQQVKVSPNPFSAQSQLIFDLPQSGTVQVAITDLTGRRTYETTLTLSAGKQVIDIPGSVLPAGSIGIYSLTTQAGSVSGKIVKN